ncbi:leucyl aminopeptidase [Solwaraspora sp. WMMD406]|uniref:leucyl aminopeptidase n=1 Tax=Solwaraspora sp. WMMD406 TaxID=3016095 RepID=UPI0024163811|nr:leucyl aminopeptidase [Solwaraspora sp. WMMD406]MDG4765124.1 leucyl aminopeptidase [Solwaraspora sp. WMMD406]
MTSPTTTLDLVDTDPAELAVDALVIGVYSQDGTADQTTADGSSGTTPALLLATGAESIAVAFEGRLTQTLALLGATGSPGEVVKLATLGTIGPPLLVAIGLGPEPAGAAPAPETLRRATGAAVRALAGTARVALALPVPDDADGPAALRAVAEGALLGSYRFAGYKTRPQPGRRRPVASVSVHVTDAADPAAQAEVARAGAVCAAVAASRDWVNAAPNELRPPEFADAVRAAATAAGLTVQVLDEAALAAGGYGGILAVGGGSAAPPRLVIISYTPEDVAGAGTQSGQDPESGSGRPRIALVGKGITFDTGGVSIKPAQGMWEMKSDMAGAAAVGAAMLAIAVLKPAVPVTAYLPMAENMPSGTAYRPGDVVTMFNGKRVEVLNTDAEGRMVLGDAMARACADGCDYLLETSTLTGGQVVALGKRIAGVMGTAELCARVQASGDAVGEPAWPMPLPDDVRKGMESDVADISQVNASMDRAGHMLQGGVFLREFVSDDVAWAHIDVAGPSFHSGEPTGYWSKGGTGVPVRTLVHLVEDIAANG